MRLTLSVLRCPASAVTETRSFDGGEVSLGRGPDNDWVLADPERHLSKRHCVLAFHGGGWQVADVSTNGTYLNSSSQPLGQGHPSPLETGDRLRLGEYEMEVRVAPAPAASPWADPAWHPPPERGAAAPSWREAPSWSGAGAASGGSWQQDPFGRDPLGPPPAPVPPEPVAQLGDGVGERGITLPADYDPMSPDHGPEGDRDLWRQPTQSAHSPAIDEAFQPVPVVNPLPDDWDDLLADLPGASPAQTPAPPAPRPAAPPAAPPGTPPIEADVFAPGPPSAPPRPATAAPRPAVPPPGPPAEAEAFAPEPPPRPAPAAPPPPAGPFGSDPIPFEPAPPPPPATPRGVPPAQAPVATASAGDSSLVAALLAGADLSEFQVTDPEAAMRQAGTMLRAAIAGLRQVLIARSAVKSEFRIDRTLLSARGNNPLKVSVDDDAALETLLGPRRRSDMPPAMAVADALRDVRLHELATMTAMQSAIRAVVAAFDPAPLLQGAGGGLAMQRKARAWDAFEALHAKITQGLTDDFDSVFGKSFARAYEQAQDELASRAQDGPSAWDAEERRR